MCGTMAESTKENTGMIRNMVMVFTYGQMEDVMNGIGTKESNMV